MSEVETINANEVDVVKESLWRNEGVVVYVKDILEGMGGMEGDEKFALIASGLSSAVIPCSALAEKWENITDDLLPMNWQHTATLSAGSEEETVKLLDLLSLQAMEICSQGVTPFEQIDEEKEGNMKDHTTDFGIACGYWEKAIAQLNSEEDEDGEQQLVVQVILYGKLFTGLFEDLDLNEENIGELLTVSPQFSSSLGDDDVLSAVCFDLARR